MIRKRSVLLWILAVAMGMITVQRAEALCTWTVDPSNINFGSYYVFATTNVYANSPFSIRCLSSDRARVRLSRGTNSPSWDPRTMAGPGGTVQYNLFRDAAATTTIWGNGNAGTSFFDEQTTNLTFNVIIYGRILAGQDVRAGSYSDTITATLTTNGGSPQVRTFTVSVIVISECTISAADLNFGAYDPVVANASAPRPGSANITVLCTRGTSISVGLNGGLAANGPKTAFGSRSMKLSTANEWMGYDIFTTSGYTLIWNSTNLLTATAASKNTSMPFSGFGRILPAQDVSVGSYADTVTATVNY